jgi:hypothetical protein
MHINNPSLCLIYGTLPPAKRRVIYSIDHIYIIYMDPRKQINIKILHDLLFCFACSSCH